MRVDRATRARAALVILVVFAIVSGADSAARLTIRSLRDRAAGDLTSRYDLRYRPLRAQLPARGMVGYVSDKLDAGRFSSLEGMREYFLTQYSLAPLIVVVGPDHDLVVGNFPDDRPTSLPFQLKGRSFEDLGDGVLLFGDVKR